MRPSGYESDNTLRDPKANRLVTPDYGPNGKLTPFNGTKFSNKTSEKSMLRWIACFVFILPILHDFPQQGIPLHAGRTTRSESHCYSCY